MALSTQINVKLISSLLLILGALNWIFVAMQMEHTDTIHDGIYFVGKDLTSPNMLRQIQMIVYSAVALAGAYHAYQVITPLRMIMM